MERENLPGIKTGRHAPEFLKAAKEQARAGKQSDGERHLHADKQPLQRVARRHLSSAGLCQRTGHVPARAANCREQPADQRCKHGTHQRIQHDSPVQANLFHARQVSGERPKHPRGRVSHKQAERSARYRQNKNFGQQLSHDGGA